MVVVKMVSIPAIGGVKIQSTFYARVHVEANIHVQMLVMIPTMEVFCSMLGVAMAVALVTLSDMIQK